MTDEVKWIRMKVGMFDGNSFKKIKRAKIGGVSYRDKLTAVWFELLDLAGKCNHDGYLIDNNEIPYETYEDIAMMLDREEKEIELCMTFFVNERMIEIINKTYCITNFISYQNAEGLEKIREQKRLSQQRWREKKQKAVTEGMGEICAYCGGEATTVDHIVAKNNGGKDILSNLVPACRRCNCTKKDWDLLVFLNDPFSTFISKELVLSNEKFGVIFNEETQKYEYKKDKEKEKESVDIYTPSTDHLLSYSSSISNSNSISSSNNNINKKNKIEDINNINIYNYKEFYSFSERIRLHLNNWFAYKKDSGCIYRGQELIDFLERTKKTIEEKGEDFVVNNLISACNQLHDKKFREKN